MLELGGGAVLAIVVLCLGLVKILRGPVGEVLADRMRGLPRGRTDDALSAEVEALKHRLAEVEERLDFAERLLARGADGQQLFGGANR